MRGPMVLSLDSDAFAGFKADFKKILEQTLAAMMEKGVATASVSAKIDVTLMEMFDSVLGENVTTPNFRHKVTASIRLKSEASGECGGMGFKLLWNKEHSAFVMTPIEDEQASMFDA